MGGQEKRLDGQEVRWYGRSGGRLDGKEFGWYVSNKQVQHQEVISVHAAYRLDTHTCLVKYYMLRVKK